jgi:hypothetical protein
MTLDARLDVQVEDAVTFLLTVTNPTTERVELTFRDGQTVEVVVRPAEGAGDDDRNALGDVVWRFGDGRAFTQAIRTEVLAPGEQARERLTWDDPEPGSYVATASLAAEEVSASAETAFEV